MTAEAGHHASKVYVDQSGAFHLNGAPFFDSNEIDISDQLDAINAASAALLAAVGVLTTAEVGYLDGASTAQVVASKAVVADAAGKINLMRLGGAAASASGLLIGVGTSLAPAATSTADTNFVEVRAKTTATTGDNRLGYFRYEIGAAGGGECLRALTALTAASGTVRGAHISLVPSGDGAVSGLGTALSVTLHFGAAAFVTGNVACLEANPYADDTGAPPTEHGAIRVASGGNATGAAKFKNVLHVSPLAGQVGDKAAALMVCNADVTGGGGAANGGLQVRINGTQYWIPLYSI